MDEFESQPQNGETIPPPQGTNRRNFLKVAVVSSAAAAAAVGGAGAAAVALSGRGASPLSKLVVLDGIVSTEHACWTNTEYQELSKYPAQADVFFWAWFTLPSHNGTSDQFTFSLVTPLPSFLAYPNGNGNYVKVYSNMTGCQSSAPTATPITQGSSLPITFTPSASTTTVLLQVHLSANNANSQTFTMTVKITGPNSFSETGTQTITFNA